MSEMNRREALTLIALAPFATAAQAQPAAPRPPRPLAHPRGGEPRFFTPHEFATASVLAALILPADERSGSAVDLGVPEFIDFILSEYAGIPHRAPVRGGLAWLDAESRRRFGRNFTEVPEAQQTAILDDIAWPERARPEMSHGVAFFSRFRDLVASGFWSTEIGIADLDYRGNRVVAKWDGCPPEALRKLGVSYPESSDARTADRRGTAPQSSEHPSLDPSHRR